MMSFGTKNVKANYQWLINMIFGIRIGKAMEVYVDDIITKSMKEVEYLSYL